uniref:DNA-directed RNA polymerase N-terminal domain-containing protein n=1 Tax=Opuntia streptacantha TaxID=393608 RepID=A0A7C9EYX2_OPUST
MSSGNLHLHPATIVQRFDCHFPVHESAHNSRTNPSFDSKIMWRNFVKQGIWRTPKLSLKRLYLSRSYSSLGASQHSFVIEKWKFSPFELTASKNANVSEVGFFGNGGSLSKEEIWERPISGCLSNQANLNGFFPKAYAGLAEAEVASDDIADDISVEGVMELVQEMRKKEERKKMGVVREEKVKSVGSLSPCKYQMLEDRQLKIETQAWQQAINEYMEVMSEMCKQKLAPTLPYVKSLLLGWFEPLRDSIEEEQELIRQGKCRAAYAPYFDQLPAEMMSIITMHKLMGLLMTGGDPGSAKVVHAACAIGEAIEQEVGQLELSFVCLFHSL